MSADTTVRALVEREFAAAGLNPVSVQIRSFPGETIAIVEVDSNYERALLVAQALDGKIENGFVTVRQVAAKRVSKVATRSVQNVHDERVGTLLELLNARSRTSETQPSLRFVKDIDERLSLAVSARHQLVFGRRGVGKTSLLL